MNTLRCWQGLQRTQPLFFLRFATPEQFTLRGSRVTSDGLCASSTVFGAMTAQRLHASTRSRSSSRTKAHTNTTATKKKPAKKSPASSKRGASSLEQERARDQAEEQKMEENDTRLAIRMLMSRHLAREAARQKPEERRREAQREALRLQQGDRLKRLEEKTRNSMALLGADAETVGDGVLPYFVRDDAASVSTTRPSAKGTTPAWLRDNSVTSAEASTQVLGGAAAASATPSAWLDEDHESTAPRPAGLLSLYHLRKPDLSIYDSTFDQRISSEEVLQRESAMTKLTQEAGVVFEDEPLEGEAEANDDVAVPAAETESESIKAERELAELLRSTDRAEEDQVGIAPADTNATNTSMELFRVSARTAAALRAQLRAQEEEEGEDRFSISPYEADTDSDADRDLWML